MRKKVIGFLLVFILVLSSLVFVIAQVPNPGHSWDQMVKDLNLTVDTFANRVGIGTTAPQQKLHVHNGSLGFTYSNFSHLKFSIGLDPNATGYEPFLWTQIGQGLRIGVGEAGEVMRITTNGSVGIGTTKPETKLHVSGGPARFEHNANSVQLVGVDHVYQEFYPRGVDAGRFAWFGFGGNGTEILSIVNQRQSRLDLGTNYTTRLSISGNGSVGIGTTNPQQKLHVHGGSLGFTSSNLSRLEFNIGLNSSERGYEPFLWTQKGQGLRIVVGEAGEVMRITTNGRVGIGTTNPTSKLTVAGNVNITGNSILGVRGIAVQAGQNLDIAGGDVNITGNSILGVRGIAAQAGENLDIAYNQSNNIYFKSGTTKGRVFFRGDGIEAGKICFGADCRTSWPGSGTANYVPLWLSSTQLGNSNIYQSGGNIGIGTTNPTSKLTVAGNVDITGNGIIGVKTIAAPAQPGENLDIAYGQSNNIYFKSATNSGRVFFGGDGIQAGKICFGADCRTSWPVASCATYQVDFDRGEKDKELQCPDGTKVISGGGYCGGVNNLVSSDIVPPGWVSNKGTYMPNGGWQITCSTSGDYYRRVRVTCCSNIVH